MKKLSYFIAILLIACQPIQIEKTLKFEGLPEDRELSGVLECKNQFGLPWDEKTQILINKTETTIVLFELSYCTVEYRVFYKGYKDGLYKRSFQINSSVEQTVTLKRKYTDIKISID